MATRRVLSSLLLIGTLVSLAVGSASVEAKKDQPFVATFVAQGQISCSVGFWSIATIDQCAANGLGQGLHDLSFALPSGSITGAVFELDWTPSGAVGNDCLMLVYPLPLASNPVYTTNDRLGPGQSVSGSPAVQLKIEASALDEPIYASSGTAVAHFQVRAPNSQPSEPDECLVNVVLQQQFTLYASFFYGAEIPQDFTNLA